MKSILIIFGLLIFVSCDKKGHYSKSILTQKNNATQVPTEYDLVKTIYVLDEMDLSKNSVGVLETRFYYFQPLFGGFNEYYKVNYIDSILTLKEFTLVDPAGMGEDSVYSTKTVKLTENNIIKIYHLLDKSMFWNLKTNNESQLHFDGDTYIYESVRIGTGKFKNDTSNYHIVYCHAPKNSDFINFGQYLRFLGGQKNIYKD